MPKITGRSPLAAGSRSWNRATFAADLTHSLLPGRAVGSSTPTFSRASTAYVADHENVMRQVLTGEARFWGARRVANLLASSGDLTTASYGGNFISRTGGQADSQGGTRACLVTADGSVNSHSSNCATMSTTPAVGDVRIMAADFKAGTTDLVQITPSTTWVSGAPYANFSLTSGTVTSSGGTGLVASGVISLGNGWYRCWIAVTVTTAIAGLGIIAIFIPDASAARNPSFATSATFLIGRPQTEDVTGQSVRTPGEYISTNVLSLPFHGANVDGVACFNTVRLHTQNGLTFSNDFSNAVWTKTDTTLTSTNNTAPDGAATASLMTVGVAGTELLVQNSVSILPGQLYTASVSMKRGNFDWVRLHMSDGATTNFGRVWFNLNTGAIGTIGSSGRATNVSATIVDEGSGWYRLSVTARVDSTSVLGLLLVRTATADGGFTSVNNGTYLVFNASVRGGSASYLSTYMPTTTAAVGPTDTGTTAPIPATTALGVLAELDATNLCTQPLAYSNVAWAKVDIAAGPTDNSVISPSGALDASTWTEGVAGTASMSLTSAAAAAGSKVLFSVYLKASGPTAWVRVRAFDTTTPADGVTGWFNLATGAKGAVTAAGAATAATSSIEALSGGWYRCEIGCIPNALSTQCALFIISASGDTLTTRTNSAVIQAWVSQHEAAGGSSGEGATSPIPTASLRPADLLTYPAANNIDAAVGTGYAEFTVRTQVTPNSGRILAYQGATSASSLMAGGTFLLQATDGTNFPAIAGALTRFTTYKGVHAFGGATQSLARTGASANDQAYDGAMGSTLSAINIGSLASANLGGACIRNVRTYQQKLSNAQLAAMVV